MVKPILKKLKKLPENREHGNSKYGFHLLTPFATSGQVLAFRGFEDWQRIRSAACHHGRRYGVQLKVKKSIDDKSIIVWRVK
jgi:hypothetical protein